MRAHVSMLHLSRYTVCSDGRVDRGSKSQQSRCCMCVRIAPALLPSHANPVHPCMGRTT